MSAGACSDTGYPVLSWYESDIPDRWDVQL